MKAFFERLFGITKARELRWAATPRQVPDYLKNLHDVSFGQVYQCDKIKNIHRYMAVHRDETGMFHMDDCVVDVSKKPPEHKASRCFSGESAYDTAVKIYSYYRWDLQDEGYTALHGQGRDADYKKFFQKYAVGFDEDGFPFEVKAGDVKTGAVFLRGEGVAKAFAAAAPSPEEINNWNNVAEILNSGLQVVDDGDIYVCAAKQVKALQERWDNISRTGFDYWSRRHFIRRVTELDVEDVYDNSIPHAAKLLGHNAIFALLVAGANVYENMASLKDFTDADKVAMIAECATAVKGLAADPKVEIHALTAEKLCDIMMKGKKPEGIAYPSVVLQQAYKQQKQQEEMRENCDLVTGECRKKKSADKRKDGYNR